MKRLTEILPVKARPGKHRISDTNGKWDQMTSTPTLKSSGRHIPEPEVSPVSGDGNQTGPLPDSPELLLCRNDEAEQMNENDVYEDEPADDKSFMELSEWGLYPSVLKWYEAKGVTSLFPWQRDCLRSPGVLDGKNLIFSAPTSAGKTMVADILIMKQVFNQRKKVLVVLPFVAIVREKMNDLQSMLKGTHIRIGAFMGSFHTKGGFDAVDIAVTTFEKANGHINRLCQENRLDTLGAVVVDEIHLIDDSSRGYLLELMLAKIMMANRQSASQIQVIGMSATLPNVHDLGTWLNAYVYQTDYRPIPLTQMILVGNDVLNVETGEVVSHLPVSVAENARLEALAIRYLTQELSVLVFENNKKNIEEQSLRLSRRIRDSINKQGTSASNKREQMRQNILKLQENGIPIIRSQLKNSSVKVDDDLLQAIEFGVGFHHAGLPLEHRDIMEEAFKKGYIKILFATSTLSSGVNLPARVVIVKTPCNYNGKEIMDVLTYQQMIGRAGRKGIDEKGESIVICTKAQEDFGWQLVKSLPSNITSCLSVRVAHSSVCLQRALLEAIVIGLVRTDEHVSEYLRCTLAMSQADDEMRERFENQQEEAISFLTNKDHCFVVRSESDSLVHLKPGQLGKAVVAAGLPPNEGLALLADLKEARKGIVLSSDLHLLYLIIPNHSVRNILIDGSRMKELLMSFTAGGEFEPQFDVTEKLGLRYTSLALSRQYVEESRFKRFFVALALNEIINEKPIHELQAKYGLDKGLLQSLQTSVSMFAGMVASFCSKIGWSNLENLFRQLEARIEFGVQSELIELMRIPTMTVRVARRLYNANIDMVRQVAHSTPAKLLQILESSVELQSSSPLRRLSTMMWIEAHKKSMTLTEISENLVAEARTIIEKDIGPVDWEAGEKIASSQSVFKTPVKSKKTKKKRIRQITPVKALPLHKICKSIDEKVPSVPIGRNSLYEDENLSTRPEEVPVTPCAGPSRNGSDESPAKSVFSSDASQKSPTTSATTSVAPKVLFSRSGEHGSDLARKRPAAPPTPTSDVPLSKRRLQSNSLPVVDFSHNVKPAHIRRKDVTSDADMRQLMDTWKQKRFAGIFFEAKKCEAVIPIIGSRQSDQPKSSDRADGIVFQDDMRILTRIAICFGDNESFSISGKQALTLFGSILKDEISPEMSVTTFDVKHAYRIFKECFDMDRMSLLSIEWFDLKTCFWLANSENSEPDSALKLVSYYSELQAFVPFVKQMANSVSFRSAIVFPLRECMQKEILNHNNFDQIFRTIEVPVALLMAEAESRGIGVDRPYMSELAKEAKSIKKLLEERARKEADDPKLNINSVPELKRIMYTKLNLLSLVSNVDRNEWRIKKAKETKGAPDHLTTGKATLMILSKYHLFPALVMEHRKIQSARTKTITHVEDYLRDYTTNRIYSHFTTWSATGRIHMGEPDLQKTQNTFTVKFFTPAGEEQTREINVRKVFVPSEGYHFVSADYRQLELRILAYLCRDHKLMDLLASDGDVFSELAAQLNDKWAEDVTYEERQHAKTLVYGIIYGMGSLQLSKQLEVSEEEAKLFRDNFHNTFPDIQVYIKKLQDTATQQGYAETLLGRRRILSSARSSNGDDRNRAMRQAVNTTIQGSAADLVKLAMIHLDQNIREQDMPAFLVHEMHDELIYEVRKDNVKSFAKLIAETMQDVAKKEFPDTFEVPLPVKVRTGPNWGEFVDLEV